MYRILFATLMGVCLGLTGCQELQNSATDEGTAEEAQEVTARFCHIARIGSLAEMPDDVWDSPKTDASTETNSEEAEEETGKDSGKDSGKKTKTDKKKEAGKGRKADLEAKLDTDSEDNAEEVELEMNDEELGLTSISDLEEATISQAVADEVDADFLAIVESAAAEASTDEGIQASNKKEEELELAIELVHEEQTAETEMQEKMAKMKDFEDDSEVVSDAKKVKRAKNTDDDSTTMEILEVEEDEDDGTDNANDADSVDGEMLVEGGFEDAENLEDAEISEMAESSESSKTVKKAKSVTEERQMSAQMEAELERQAEACLELLKNTPKEVREEIKKANFQNVSYRLVKIPGSLIFGKTAPEYYLIRTMEYTGINLAKDYQTLILSPKFSKWIQEQEKYLDIITLDERHHEFWVEVPEFWNSSVIE